MTRDEYIDLLKQKGLLRDGLASGAISSTHVRDAKIRDDFRKKKREVGYVVAVCMVAHEYRLSDDRVKAIVRGL